jgi:GH24 family phage-related lysozyme (muramidase)
MPIFVIFILLIAYLVKKMFFDFGLSETGVSFLVKEEGFRDQDFKLRTRLDSKYKFRPYKDHLGNYTAGIGHLVLPGEEHLRTSVLTFDQAIALFRSDVSKVVKAARRYVKPWDSLKAHQKDALISFGFQNGVGALKRSALVANINEGDFSSDSIMQSFCNWSSGGFALPRRTREANLFNFGIYNVIKEEKNNV